MWPRARLGYGNSGWAMGSRAANPERQRLPRAPAALESAVLVQRPAAGSDRAAPGSPPGAPRTAERAVQSTYGNRSEVLFRLKTRALAPRKGAGP